MLLNAFAKIPSPHASALRKYAGPVLRYDGQTWTKDVAIAAALPTLVGFAVPATGAYASSDLPAGISLDPDSGALTGTPTVEAYSQVFHVTATDTLGVDHVATVFYSTELAPSIAYAGSPFTWVVDAAIAPASVTSSGGQVASYAVHSGALPAGVALDPDTGDLTGTPTSVGSGAAVIRATGPSGLTDDATVDWAVAAQSLLPLFTSGGYWAVEGLM